jgi:exopolysaccharide biosynthesis polyprenyl glycosylphosphotransferase
MFKSSKIKQLVLFLGDLIVLYFSLFLTLFIRYGTISEDVRVFHFPPFTILFIFSILVFYIMGFYELQEQKNTHEFAKKFGVMLFINLFLAIVFFYFVPWFAITPKTNLFIFIFLFAASIYTWRTSFNNVIRSAIPAKKILFVGHNQTTEEVAEHITNNPQIGYEVKFWMKEGLHDKEFKHFSQIILTHKIDIIVVPAHIRKRSRAARVIYQNLSLGITVMTLAELYEVIFQKVPITELEEVWFLEHLAHDKKLYDSLRRPAEILFAFLLIIFTAPLAILIMFAVKLTSQGSTFFTQTRIGKNGRKFILWKFRTMHMHAEKDGAKWAKPNDERRTILGRLLRKTHLDELPQLFNVVSGDLSLVGPRPERPEFTSMLEKEIPYYSLRHLVRPGLTGWAQIKYRYGASLDDAYEKTQYDIYYLKNRNLWFDIGIILRTIKLFFVEA